MDLVALTPSEAVLIKQWLDKIRRDPASATDKEDIVRFSQSTDCYVALTPSGGIPARSTTTPGNAECDLYVVAEGDSADIALQDIDKSAIVANVSESEIEGSTYVLCVKTKGGTYVAVTGGGGGSDRTAIVKVTGSLEQATCCYPGTIETVADGTIESPCGNPFDTHTECKIVVINADGGTFAVGTGTSMRRREPETGDYFIGQKIGTLNYGTGSGSQFDGIPVYGIRVDQGAGVMWYVSSLGSDLNPSDLTFSATLEALDGSGSTGSVTVNNPLHTGGSSGDAIYVVKNDTGETTEYDLVRVALHECT